MDLLKQDMKRMPRLLIGYIFLGLGVALTKKAGLGLDPWGVFHDGLDQVIPFLTFGQIIVVLGLVIMGISMVTLKTKIGIGTILNALLVGFIIDFFGYVFSMEITSIYINIFIFMSGLLTMTFGRALYISADLGPGPRDGLFVGLTRVTGIHVKYGKPLIEAIVLLTGFIMGGTIGYGTFVLIVSTGFFVHMFFTLLGFDPKQKRQSDITLYFKKAKGSQQ